MILRRITAHVQEQNWTAIAIDFVIVVVGVFIGIQVSNWNAERVERAREVSYLIALTEDFGAIIAELESDIARYESIANAMTLLLEQSRRAAPDTTLAALNEAAALLVRMEGTPIVSDTYANLTGSGDLALLRSQAVKNAMSSFFGKAEVVQLVGDTHEMQLVNIFQPYIIDHLDYAGMFRDNQGLSTSAGFEPDRILTALPTARFRNVVAVKWDIVTDLRGLLLSALAEAKAVETLLAAEAEANR
ncbi:hypothetical protein [Rubrivirga sp. IMCC43871]|uniref:hypothetical protein n=1 Tax=Rubrivirga sp. IMCC43871 TaxID=3391575 RepID=UPI00398FFC2D